MTDHLYHYRAVVTRIIDGDSETRALVAWSKVTRAIREIGAWESVIFDDAKIHAVIVEMGGWIELCRKTTKELDFLLREFEKRYHFYRNRTEQNFPTKLIGKTEQTNGYQNSDAIVQPRLIGIQNIHTALKLID